MRYKVLEAQSTSTLEALVQQHFQQGWKVQGGVAIKYTPSKTTFYQALTNAN